MTRPLTDLSKNDVQFDWTPSCTSAFNALKHALTSAPVLAFLDPDKDSELVCDASDFGLDAILLQELCSRRSHLRFTSQSHVTVSALTPSQRLEQAPKFHRFEISTLKPILDSSQQAASDDAKH